MPPSPARAERLAALRAEVRALESAGSEEERLFLPFGVEAIDSRLAAGGLPVASLNEAAGEHPGPADEAAATLFLA
ncbi:MAG TPA: protein ImuA, partial [Allosphingosinicella sp.]